MTLTINLSHEQATMLQAKAEAEGLSSVEAWIQKLAEPDSTVSGPRRRISEIIRENMSRVPPEMMAAMPTDGAGQHDHYIYGLPKREACEWFSAIRFTGSL